MNEKTRTSSNRCDGVAAIEDPNAQLELALIAEYKAPYKDQWDAMSAEQRKEIDTKASVYASGKLAAMHSCNGLLLGFIALLQAARGLG